MSDLSLWGSLRLGLIGGLSATFLLLLGACGDRDPGTAPSDGAAEPIQIAGEPPGANCPAGGVAITVTDGDGSETTEYVCNGTTPSGGGGNAEVSEEPPGANCPQGGLKLTVTEADGSTTDHYVCNSGPADTVTVQAEPPGANCTYGGYRLEHSSDGSVEYICEASDISQMCLDEDGDEHGYGGACLGPDCNDAQASIYDGAPEVPYNGIDEDCDGIDTWDADGDGFTAPGAPYGAGDDCDDGDETTSPAATDVPADDVDQDCDGDPFDADGDGADDLLGDDCDDGDATRSPALSEVAGDGIDNDCDPMTRDDDFDRDGDGVTSPIAVGGSPDCDDTDPTVFPGAGELPDDGIDNDCDGVLLVADDTTGIFVAPSGDDSNAGTQVAPLATIGQGVTLASAAGVDVFVAAGDYVGQVVTDVSIFGGYSDDGSWSRDPATYVTRLSAPAGLPAATSYATLTVPAGASVTLSDLEVTGPDADAEVRSLDIQGAARLRSLLLQGGTASGGGNRSIGLRTAGSVEGVSLRITGGTAVARVFSVDVAASGSLVLHDSVIRGGTSSNDDVYGVRTDGTATLHRCDIAGGSGNVSAAGANVEGGAFTVYGGRIRGGTGFNGGSWGINNISGDVIVDGARVEAAGAQLSVHGIQSTNGGSLLVVNSSINATQGVAVANTGSGWGIVTNISPGPTTVVGSVVYAGRAPSVTRGIQVQSELTLINSVVHAGYASNAIGVTVRNDFGGSARLYNTAIWNGRNDLMLRSVAPGGVVDNRNTAGRVNDCTWVGCLASERNFRGAPLFVDPFGDTHLLAESPLIDFGRDPTTLDWSTLGTPDPTPYLGTDMDGEPRPYGDGWDIGADEYVPVAPPVDADLDGQPLPADCDDGDVLVGPHMPELPDDGRDNDCAGDGDQSRSEAIGVFVSDSLGNDTSGDGSMATPYKTIGRALSDAVAAGKAVFVMQGNYNEDVAADASIFGGYDGTWQREPAAYPTVITGAGSPAVEISGTGIVIDGVTLVGANLVGSISTVGVRESGSLVLSRSVVEAPDGNASSISGTSHGIWTAGHLLAVANTVQGGAAIDLVNCVWVDAAPPPRTASATLIANNLACGSGARSIGFGAINKAQATLLGNTIDGGTAFANPSFAVSNEDSNVTLVGNTLTDGVGDPGTRCIHNVGRTLARGNTLLAGRQDLFRNRSAAHNYGVLWLLDNRVEAQFGLRNGFIAMMVGNDMDLSGASHTSLEPSPGAPSWTTAVRNILYSEGTCLRVDHTGAILRAHANEVTARTGAWVRDGGMVLYNNLFRQDPSFPGNRSISFRAGFLAAMGNTLTTDVHGSNLGIDMTFGAAGNVYLYNNNVIAGTTGLHVRYATSTWLRHNNFWGPSLDWLMLRDFWNGSAWQVGYNTNDLGVMNSCQDARWGGCAQTGGNISIDPEVVARGQDFHLQSQSWLVDAGTDPGRDHFNPYLFEDFDGNPRGVDGNGDGVAQWDIGAYELQPD